MLSCHKHISRLSGDFLVSSNSPFLPFSTAFLSVGFFVFLCCVCSGCGTDEPQEGRHTGSSAVPISFHPRGVFRVAHSRVRYRTGRTFKRCATSTAVGGVVSSVSHIHVRRTGVCVHITARQGV